MYETHLKPPQSSVYVHFEADQKLIWCEKFIWMARRSLWRRSLPLHSFPAGRPLPPLPQSESDRPSLFFLFGRCCAEGREAPRPGHLLHCLADLNLTHQIKSIWCEKFNTAVIARKEGG